jgi:hypothetical protein
MSAPQFAEDAGLLKRDLKALKNGCWRGGKRARPLTAAVRRCI